MPRWIQAFLVPIVLVICGFWTQAIIAKAPDRLPREIRAPTPIPVALWDVVPRAVERTYTGLGDLEPRHVSTIASQVSGVIDSVPFEPVGGQVAADQVLLTLDDTDLSLLVDEARARESAALATIRRLEKDRELSQGERDLQEELRDLVQAEVPRREGLLDKELVVPSLLEVARTLAVREALRLAAEERRLALLDEDLVSAQAELAVLRAVRERAEWDWSKATVTAPFPAIVSSRDVESGDRVSPGTPLFELTDLTALRVQVAVPASLVESISLGATAQVDVLGSGRTAAGQVLEIHPRADRRNRTYTVVVEIPNPGDRPTLPGQAARVTLQRSPRAGALAVPAEAVTLRGGRQVVFRLVAEQSTLEQVTVKVAEDLGPWLVIGDGLDSGDRIAAEDLELLFDGAPWCLPDAPGSETPPSGSPP